MVNQACQRCHKEYQVNLWRADKTRYCSNKCRYEDYEVTKSGDKNPAWKGGNRYNGRPSFAHKWAKQVKTRDNFTCRECGCTENLHAHHITEWQMDNNRRYELDNGVTLCKECHHKQHPYLYSYLRKFKEEKCLTN